MTLSVNPVVHKRVLRKKDICQFCGGTSSMGIDNPVGEDGLHDACRWKVANQIRDNFKGASIPEKLRAITK